VLGDLGGFGEHLDDLFERGGVCLDECCRVRISGVGSGDGYV
jgi:hypothetical protein